MARTPHSGNGGTQIGTSANGPSVPSVGERQNARPSNTVRPSAAPAREGRTDAVDRPRSRRRAVQGAREGESPASESPRPESASSRREPESQKVSENSIRPTPRPIRGVSPPSHEAPHSAARVDAAAAAKLRVPSSPAPPTDVDEPEKGLDRQSMPEDVKRRFVRVGNKYHFPDGARAFTDHGNRLTSPSENTEVIKSLIAIAQVRGWSDITVTGTDRFRKEAWLAGRLAGLEVRGYVPNEFEQGRLVRALARVQEPAPRDPPRPPAPPDGNSTGSRRAREARAEVHSEPRERQRNLQVGRLVDHGAAPYLNDPHNAMSYFIRIETDAGERVIWGVDLHRALKESLTRPQIGDEIGLRSLRRERVKVWQSERDADGRLVSEKRLEKHRNVWVIEKRDFFRKRAQASGVLRDGSVDQQQAVERHPELLGTYLQLHAAELAARNIRDPEDQRRFVASVRNALADSVARGEPLPPVRLKDTAAQSREPHSSSPPVPAEREPLPGRGTSAREPAPVRG